MRRTEIERRFDEIVDFAEIERFLDTPVKHYSSGMYVRLAFAVAAHLEPEILLVDEVLAVGDAAFQKKCLGKMDEVAQEGRTVLFVSHNMPATQALCERAILLREGRVNSVGHTSKVVDRYLKTITETATTYSLRDNPTRLGDGPARLVGFHLEDRNGESIQSLRTGQSCFFVFEYQTEDEETCASIDIAFGLRNSLGVRVTRMSMGDQGEQFNNVPPRGMIKCYFDRFPLQSGSYTMGVVANVGGAVSDLLMDAATVGVESGDFFGAGRITDNGPVFVEHQWQIKGK
jgi:lipopolysaccharide transport system ATP-binding protein